MRRRHLGGSVRHRRRPDLPRDHLAEPYFGEGGSRSRRSTSGRAASASGARSPAVRSAPGSLPAHGVPLRPFADAVAPGAGRAGDRPLGQLVQQRAVRQADRPALGPGDRRRSTGPTAKPQFATYHPTFLYESLWNLGVPRCSSAGERRFRLAGGRAFALYVMGYASGRVWIEAMRIDGPTRSGSALNIWTSIIVFAVAATYFITPPRKRGHTMRDSGSQDDPDPSSSVPAGGRR